MSGPWAGLGGGVMINWWTAQEHRGYTIYRRYRDDKTDYIGVQGIDAWFEGATPEEVKANIDKAYAEIPVPIY